MAKYVRFVCCLSLLLLVTDTSALKVSAKSSNGKLPASLLYQDTEGIWYTDRQGIPIFISEPKPEYTTIHISPDRNYVLFSFSGEGHYYTVSLADLATGKETYLNIDPKYGICASQWWTENLIILALEEVAYAGYSCSIQLATIQPDGKSFQMLKVGGDNFDSSTDRRTIAIEINGEPYLYRAEIGLEPFDISSFGFPDLTERYIGLPYWSPDSKKLAWNISGVLDGEVQQGIGIFNFESQSSHFLYPYEIHGFDGGGSSITWSPDGQFIHVFNHGKDLSWIIRTDGEPTLLSEFSEEFLNWSPDGKWLAALDKQNKEDEISTLWIVSTDDKERHQLTGQDAIWRLDSAQLLLINSEWHEIAGYSHCIWEVATEKTDCFQLNAQIHLWNN